MKALVFFSNPVKDEYRAILTRRAIVITQDTFYSQALLMQIHTIFLDLPVLIFQQSESSSDPLTSYSTIAKTIKGAINQKQPIDWCRTSYPQQADKGTSSSLPLFCTFVPK